MRGGILFWEMKLLLRYGPRVTAFLAQNTLSFLNLGAGFCLICE
jgi:hypothetical protein